MRFLEIKYIAKIKRNGRVFESSEKPIIVPIGKGFLHDFLEKALEKVEAGKKYTFVFEKPFGERDESLLKIVPKSEFLKRGINPIPGMVVNIDGEIGTIRSVSGRVIVDFNHPVAGEDVIYEVEVIREVNDLKEKICGLLEFVFGIPRDAIKVDIENNKLRITTDREYIITETMKSFLKNTLEELKECEIV